MVASTSQNSPVEGEKAECFDDAKDSKKSGIISSNGYVQIIFIYYFMVFKLIC